VLSKHFSSSSVFDDGTANAPPKKYRNLKTKVATVVLHTYHQCKAHQMSYYNAFRSLRFNVLKETASNGIAKQMTMTRGHKVISWH